MHTRNEGLLAMFFAGTEIGEILATEWKSFIKIYQFGQNGSSLFFGGRGFFVFFLKNLSLSLSTTFN